MPGTDHSVFADAATSLAVWACAATIGGAVRSQTSSPANIRSGLHDSVAHRDCTDRRLFEPAIGQRSQGDAKAAIAVAARKIARW